jgi:chromosome segregation ATPase
MDSDSSLSNRKEIVNKLNENLEEIGQINMKLKFIKQQNKSLEERLSNERINYDNSEKDIKVLKEKLEELQKKK